MKRFFTWMLFNGILALSAIAGLIYNIKPVFVGMSIAVVVFAFMTISMWLSRAGRETLYNGPRSPVPIIVEESFDIFLAMLFFWYGHYIIGAIMLLWFKIENDVQQEIRKRAAAALEND